jgi:hypothetical protein
MQSWREVSEKYLNHLEFNASDEAIIVSASDKTHNIMSTIIDYKVVGQELWQRFTTKNANDQLWWYESILAVIKKRNAPKPLIEKLESNVNELKDLLKK